MKKQLLIIWTVLVGSLLVSADDKTVLVSPLEVTQEYVEVTLGGGEEMGLRVIDQRRYLTHVKHPTELLLRPVRKGKMGSSRPKEDGILFRVYWPGPCPCTVDATGEDDEIIESWLIDPSD